eukprot:m.20699 g.20699  ORF g.20699 m.20699 type:complete len:166 (-) comp13056_c0_seq1:397-894(-)
MIAQRNARFKCFGGCTIALMKNAVTSAMEICTQQHNSIIQACLALSGVNPFPNDVAIRHGSKQTMHNRDTCCKAVWVKIPRRAIGSEASTLPPAVDSEDRGYTASSAPTQFSTRIVATVLNAPTIAFSFGSIIVEDEHNVRRGARTSMSNLLNDNVSGASLVRLT